MGRATVYIVQFYLVMWEFIVFTVTVDPVQIFCNVCGVYCG